jgi:hypothetical protein
MKRKSVCMFAGIVLAGSGGFSTVRAAEGERSPYPPPAANVGAAARRGQYLVVTGGCHDCHTPSKAGPEGPVPDFSRMLSGHPEQLEVPAAPALPAPWMMVAASSMTAFSGPWGVSFSANLTPDKETGLGNWTERNFIEAIRTGHHLGRGRPILPPMPWMAVREHSDSDLKAIWAYLRTVPAIKNRVPAPRPPDATTDGTAPAGRH